MENTEMTPTKETSSDPVTNEQKFHRLYDDLIRCLKRNLNVFLVGPAGSGKTRAVEMAAITLKKDFYCQSVSAQTTLAHLFGYNDANGHYVPTGFRNAFENGGVFLLDEGDAGNANVITAVNSALSNGFCSFPDGMIRKHPNFVFVMAGNTFGTGANRQYVGRNALDAATLDRFVYIEWPYDEELEMSMIPENYSDWVDRVQSYRKAVDEMGIKMIISPRASLNGHQLLDEGFDVEKTEMMTIWKGLSPDDIKKIKNKSQKEIEDKKKKREQAKNPPKPDEKGEGQGKGGAGGEGGELSEFEKMFGNAKVGEITPEMMEAARRSVMGKLALMKARQRDPLDDIRR